MIHVSTKITSVAGNLESHANKVKKSVDNFRSGTDELDRTQSSIDLDIFVAKSKQVAKTYSELQTMIHNYVVCLKFAQQKYQECQERAILLAKQVKN